ncbi:hypothetical protein MMC14_002842 [Varicellaria rhodocarpa]|nr:hypothetical protein [Varicellaria rhodocarpa]
MKSVDLFDGQEKDAANTMKTKGSRIYRFKNPEALFAKYCNEEAVQTWLENAIKRSRKTYYIVGTLTVTNATFTDKHHQKGNIICCTRALLPGEYVFGICYREVAFKNAWYERPNVGKANLRGDKWLPSVPQGKHNLRIQVVEASLVEDTQSSVEEVPLDLHKDGDEQNTAT